MNIKDVKKLQIFDAKFSNQKPKIKPTTNNNTNGK